MSYGITTNGLASIWNYETAKEHFYNTKVIRGRDKDADGVPLGGRKQWKTKRLRRLDGGKAYGAQLYDTVCVTWHEDGRVEFDASFGSQSTDRFIQYFIYNMTHGRHTTGGYLWVSSTAGATPVLTVQRYATPPMIETMHYPVTSVFTLRFTDRGAFNIDPACKVTAYKSYVDKSKAAVARKPFKAFMEYVKFIAGNPFNEDTVTQLQMNQIKALQNVVDEPDNEEHWPFLVAIFTSEAWHWGRHEYASQVDVTNLKRAVYEKAYQDARVYSRKKLPEGVLPRGWVI